jgi:hypothetical protein
VAAGRISSASAALAAAGCRSPYVLVAFAPRRAQREKTRLGAASARPTFKKKESRNYLDASSTHL